MIKTVRHIKSQTVDIEKINPVADLVQNMADYRWILKIEFDQIIVALPAFIP